MMFGRGGVKLEMLNQLLAIRGAYAIINFIKTVIPVNAMALSKTEKDLIIKAAQHGTYGAERHYGRGKEGGRIDLGRRAWEAAQKLENKGYIEVIHRNGGTDSCRGNSVHWDLVSFVLTEEGKAMAVQIANK